MILLLWLLQADFSAYISFYTSLSRIIIKCYKYCFLLTWAAQTVETLQPLFIHLYEGAAPDTSLRVKPKIFWFLVSSFETLQRQKRTTPLAVASEELLMLQCYNTPVAALCRTFPPGSQERLCMVWSARWSGAHYRRLENHWASVVTPIWTPPSNLVNLLTGMSEHPHAGRFRKLWRPAGSLLLFPMQEFMTTIQFPHVTMWFSTF